MIKIILLGSIIFTTTITLIKPLIRLPYRIFIDNNEGWIAYFSEYAIKQVPLYQSLDSFILNNYPPISFYITGVMGTLFGDMIIAGRGIALFGLLLTAFMIFLIILRFSSSIYLSITGGLLFIGYISLYHSDYVGMNDPQWIAHGFMMSGFTLFLYKKENRVLFFCSLLIMLLAGFIKHNLIPIPVAITLWLYVNDKSRFYQWIGVSFLLITIALLFMYVIYGSNFFIDIFLAPRTYRVGRIARIGIWLSPLIVYISAALMSYIVFFKERDIQLLLFSSIISLLWGAFISGGGGVYYNSIFDLIINLFIIAFVGVSRLGRIAKTNLIQGRDVTILAIFILFFPLLLTTPFELHLTKEFLKNIYNIKNQTEEDVAFVMGYPEPIMCENLALCYWAGKKFSFDFYSTGEKLKTKSMSPKNIIDRLNNKEFSLIQINDEKGKTCHLPDEVVKNIFENYAPIRKSKESGIFLVPRNKT